MGKLVRQGGGRASVTLLVLALSACGARNALWIPGPVPDGGGRDGGTDAGPGPIELECGRSTQYTTPGRPITLTAEVRAEEGIASQGWTLLEQPDGSLSTNAPTSGPETTITPDMRGTYTLEHRVTDRLGRSASCEVDVESVTGPPVAICPEEEEIVGGLGEPITIIGDAFDDTRVVEAQWVVSEAPAGAMPALRVVTGAVVELTATMPGRYVLTLTVIDEDMEIDSCSIVVRITSPPVVMCPDAPVTGPTRRPLTVRASATDDLGVASTTWEMLERPVGSGASLSPTTGESTTMTPDQRGEYVLRFTATDTDGLSASCEVLVIGLPSPPDAICPPTVETTPLSTARIEAMAIDDGRIVSTRWRRAGRPPGSSAGEPTPIDSLVTSFTPDLAGEYPLELTVTDDDGNPASCTTVVRAVATEGLRVEVFWNTDGTDMDTHLLSPTATGWFADQDCYYANCQGGPRLEWGAGGEIDNPSLDIDDTNGFGPENINIERPVNGTYRVGVHAFSGAARVTVRIYCGGSTTEPRQTFGPLMIGPGARGRDLWRVADVRIDGTGCTITDLGASIIDDDTARGTR